MKYFSMFSGIGGFELGIQRATNNTWDCIGFSEVDESAIKTYKKHFPTHKNYGDATKIQTTQLPNFELLVGGFPCQSFSNAGQRKGFNDTRGTLFFEIARIVKKKRPKYILLENVKGLLSHDKGRTFKTILSTITELGYDTEGLVLNSYYFSAAPRPRIFMFAVHREQKTNVWKGHKQTFPLYTTFSKGLRLEDCPTRDEEIGRSSGRIIRTFTKLPNWMDKWSSVYSQEKTSR